MASLILYVDMRAPFHFWISFLIVLPLVYSGFARLLMPGVWLAATGEYPGMFYEYRIAYSMILSRVVKVYKILSDVLLTNQALCGIIIKV